MNKILVTGITGKTGIYFFRELVAHADELKDYHFKVFVRTTTDTREIDSAASILSIEKYVGDKSSKEDLQEFCRGYYDTLLHISSIRDSEALVETALAGGVRRMILVHTTGVYSKYKAAGEEYRRIDRAVTDIAESYGASLTILRPTMIYGTLTDHNMSVFIKMVDKLRFCPVVNGAKYVLQPVWCGDLGKAYFQVLTSPEKTKGKSYILSGGEAIQLIDILTFIREQLNTKTQFVSIPFRLAYVGAWILWLITFHRYDIREKVQRLVEPRAYGHEAATEDFGYTPLRLREGLLLEINEYKCRNRKCGTT